MRRKVGIICLGLCMGLLAAGCTDKVEVPQEDAHSVEGEVSALPEPEEEEESEPEEEIQIDPLTERYFDYVQNHPNISFLLSNEMEGEGFSDSEIAAYVIGEFGALDAYDPDYGIAPQAFDAACERFFGRRLEDYENDKSTVLPESGYITSTGWGGSSISMILKDIQENEDGSKTAQFYQLPFGMGDPLPDRMDLLTGKLGDAGDVWLIEMDFEELEDLEGEMYWKYLSIRPQGKANGPFVPYGQDDA